MIVFREVSKQFGEDSSGVTDISFSIEPGELVFITGPSGSGKTTLMRLITKEYTPTNGEILFDDSPLSEIGQSKLHLHRRRVGVVFQDYRLIPDLNVWENVALPLYIAGTPEDEIEDRVTDLLNLVELSNKAELFQTQLSGGEAQRVSIARALATGPDIIFADEPTGNLDRETAELITDLLQQINSLGTTLLFATHDMHILESYPDHRRLHLEEGELTRDTIRKKRTKNKTKKKKSSKKDESSRDESEKKQAKDSAPEKEVSQDVDSEEATETKTSLPTVLKKAQSKIRKLLP